MDTRCYDLALQDLEQALACDKWKEEEKAVVRLDQAWTKMKMKDVRYAVNLSPSFPPSFLFPLLLSCVIVGERVVD